jgi:hypothetical protein
LSMKPARGGLDAATPAAVWPGRTRATTRSGRCAERRLRPERAVGHGKAKRVETGYAEPPSSVFAHQAGGKWRHSRVPPAPALGHGQCGSEGVPGGVRVVSDSPEAPPAIRSVSSGAPRDGPSAPGGGGGPALHRRGPARSCRHPRPSGVDPPKRGDPARVRRAEAAGRAGGAEAP